MFIRILVSGYICDRYGYGSDETRITLKDADEAFHGWYLEVLKMVQHSTCHPKYPYKPPLTKPICPKHQEGWENTKTHMWYVHR